MSQGALLGCGGDGRRRAGLTAAAHQLSTDQLPGHRHVHGGPLGEPGVGRRRAVADACVRGDQSFDLDSLTALHGAEGKLVSLVLSGQLEEQQPVQRGQRGRLGGSEPLTAAHLTVTLRKG